VVALDDTGAELVVRLTQTGERVSGEIEESRLNEAEPATSVVLYQGLLKAAKLELVLQKCTELGVAGFVPVLAARSVPSEPATARRRRFETVVREASEQSHRGKLPTVSAARSYEDALRAATSSGPVILLWEGETGRHLRELPHLTGVIGLFVGPEGGFTPDEAAQARLAGAHVVTLGPRILRAETAAIVGSALVLARHDDLG
jgi:16S rRNA (uracil1498-N3)-methyltransferase